MEIKSTNLRFFIFFLSFLMLFSFCWVNHAYGAKVSSTAYTYQISPFSSIEATGPLKIVLTTQQKKQTVTITAPQEIAEKINVLVQNYTLVIDAHRLKDQSTLRVVKIAVPYNLYNISLRGSACIYLRGNFKLHGIQNDGTGIAVITGINNKLVMVRGNGSGKIILSGKTYELNAQIGGSLVLEAQRLRTEVGHILTINYAAAYVHVFGPLHAFAYDSSSIYYYYNPSRLVRDSAGSGNVLKITPDRRLVPLEELYWL